MRYRISAFSDFQYGHQSTIFDFCSRAISWERFDWWFWNLVHLLIHMRGCALLNFSFLRFPIWPPQHDLWFLFAHDILRTLWLMILKFSTLLYTYERMSLLNLNFLRFPIWPPEHNLWFCYLRVIRWRRGICVPWTWNFLVSYFLGHPCRRQDDLSVYPGHGVCDVGGVVGVIVVQRPQFQKIFLVSKPNAQISWNLSQLWVLRSPNLCTKTRSLWPN